MIVTTEGPELFLTLIELNREMFGTKEKKMSKVIKYRLEIDQLM